MRSQYPLLPLGLPWFCPVFAVLVSRIALSLVQLILHLLHALCASPVPVTLPSSDRFAQLSSLLLQRTLCSVLPSVPLLSAAQTLLLLALRTDAGRDEALRGGVLEALLGAQLKILALNPALVSSVYAVLARLHHSVSTPHFAAAGLYERLTSLLISALTSDKPEPVKQLLNVRLPPLLLGNVLPLNVSICSYC